MRWSTPCCPRVFLRQSVLADAPSGEDDAEVLSVRGAVTGDVCTRPSAACEQCAEVGAVNRATAVKVSGAFIGVGVACDDENEIFSGLSRLGSHSNQKQGCLITSYFRIGIVSAAFVVVTAGHQR